MFFPFDFRQNNTTGKLHDAVIRIPKHCDRDIVLSVTVGGKEEKKITIDEYHERFKVTETGLIVINTTGLIVDGDVSAGFIH